MDKRKRTRTEELIEDQFIITDPKTVEKILTALDGPAYTKLVDYPEDLYFNLVGRGDIYIKRKNAVYKLNIDKFLKEFCCLTQVVFNDEGGNK